jgi:hypothetical protein
VKKPVVVRIAELQAALEDDAGEEKPRGLRKVVAPDLWPGKETLLLVEEWCAWVGNEKPVIESNTMQLSFCNGRAEQKPHWHENQVEVYTVLSGQLDVRLLDVDNDTNSRLHKQVTASIVIPPRVCHLVSVKGEYPLVQVLQFAVARGPIKNDQQVCAPNRTKCPQARDCPRHGKCPLEKIAQQ